MVGLTIKTVTNCLLPLPLVKRARIVARRSAGRLKPTVTPTVLEVSVERVRAHNGRDLR
jgi:hypothetical protein